MPRQPEMRRTLLSVHLPPEVSPAWATYGVATSSLSVWPASTMDVLGWRVAMVAPLGSVNLTVKV
ncbi:hypothetical protein J7E91_07565 [Streptomyces sp. ISL-99]|uniref:hypothetical protein n=1 Tax=Streptomyces sp. ISL-99 TaxID=2819193 RepID=UPI001BEBEBF2|nr:hypothetical protein [Streptomyces sp. ISL-99]MBT2525296.1 hypothetical protein [Streptomyces sp. ISL-99]